MAQVYSVNAVGYINLTMRPGFNMVANQLNRTPNNSLNNVITGVPVESQVLKFDNASNNYILELFDGTGWITPEGNPGTLTANPGSGLFFFNPDAANITVTLVGEVPQGNNLTVPLPSNFSLISSIVPQAIPLTARAARAPIAAAADGAPSAAVRQPAMPCAVGSATNAARFQYSRGNALAV